MENDKREYWMVRAEQCLHRALNDLAEANEYRERAQDKLIWDVKLIDRPKEEVDPKL